MSLKHPQHTVVPPSFTHHRMWFADKSEAILAMFELWENENADEITLVWRDETRRVDDKCWRVDYFKPRCTWLDNVKG